MSENGQHGSAWSPLREPLFRGLWIAAVASNIGTWLQDLGASWLMTDLAPTPLMVSLVQTATTLPMFLLALPAGALADVVDRRKLLLVSQIWMFAAAAILAGLTWAKLVSPWSLLLLTFMQGVGSALNAPAWQAIIPELVSRPQMPAAVTLQGLGFNVARAVGPALGGFIVSSFGVEATFFLNALSFIGVIVVLFQWRREAPESVLPAERFGGAMLAGIRYVRYSPALKAVLVRAAVFIFFGSALWGLLPLIVRQELREGPATLGILLGFLGIGAVLGAAVLPRFRRRFSTDGLVGAATLMFAVLTIVLGHVRDFPSLAVAMALGGVAWMTVMSSMNVAAQNAVTAWVRARALSVYLLVFFGFMAAGSTLWGWVATHHGISLAMTLAGTGMDLGLLVVPRYRLKATEGLDLAPSLHWPAPMTTDSPEPDRGPVLVMIEYLIDPGETDDFKKALRCLRPTRLRTGALRWELYTDIAQPGRYVEQFVVESWLEHLRQHERVTVEDQRAQESANRFHLGDEPPRVSHLIYGYERTRL